MSVIELALPKNIFVSSFDRNFMKKFFVLDLKNKEFFVEKNFEGYAIFLRIFLKFLKKYG